MNGRVKPSLNSQRMQAFVGDKAFATAAVLRERMKYTPCILLRPAFSMSLRFLMKGLIILIFQLVLVAPFLHSCVKQSFKFSLRTSFVKTALYTNRQIDGV